MSILPINLPERVSSGQPVSSAWANSIREAIARLANRKSPRGTGGAGISSQTIPFKLSLAFVDPDWKWQVAQTNSSVMDGTNGDAIDLGPSGADWATGAVKFNTPTTITATKYIVLKAAVDADLLVTDWELAAVDAADAEEVGTDAGPPITQNEIRLLIGKITKDTVPDPDTYTASQAVFSAQMVTHGLVNGMPTKVFASAPLQIDNL